MTPETEALKARLKATWTAGDFGRIAKSYAEGAEDFINRLELTPSVRALDVACGTGNLAVAAARARQSAGARQRAGWRRGAGYTV
jgi:2-polyprenyl-3-methyl-5-hydroxy-6-metoxy-1,4-benzoquinol methylase